MLTFARLSDTSNPNANTTQAPVLAAIAPPQAAVAPSAGATNVITTASANLPPLLRLPGELRNEIYTLLLLHHRFPYMVLTIPISLTSPHETLGRFPEPGLLEVNRQVRHETAPYFYSTNNFIAEIVRMDFGPFVQRPREVVGNGATYINLVAVNLTYPKLAQLENVFDLVKLVADTGLEIRSETVPMIFRSSSKTPARCDELMQALDDALDLALEAYEEKWTKQELENEFMQWVDEKLELGQVKKK